MRKRYRAVKAYVSESWSDQIHLSYILVLASVLVAKFSGSGTATFAAFLALFLIYAVKKYDSRIPVAFALVLLVLSAFTLAFRTEEQANEFAIYAYYYLVVGVLLQFIEYVRNPEEEAQDMKKIKHF